jgi:hypothetical protein
MRKSRFNAHEAYRREKDALLAGLARAERLGFTKPHDIITAISVELENAGLKIVRKPNRSRQGAP